ncbi:hypothetical protein HN832_01505 [archaeon]|jgi:hypothetical protein|nr:hypothetical protein [archaeon]MBT4373940.1 hypothetical protein [archaeon]MBT4532333.1 hypothetical protein [archaeon]MBT7001919.1 hypothetical protein [archaeon]MBT7282068.1 hypothetical protein [archaeon]
MTGRQKAGFITGEESPPSKRGFERGLGHYVAINFPNSNEYGRLTVIEDGCAILEPYLACVINREGNLENRWDTQNPGIIYLTPQVQSMHILTRKTIDGIKELKNKNNSKKTREKAN